MQSLGTIVVFAVSGITDRGTTAACKADTESVTVAAEAFFAKSAVVPAVYATDIASLVTAALALPAVAGVISSGSVTSPAGAITCFGTPS